MEVARGTYASIPDFITDAVRRRIEEPSKSWIVPSNNGTIKVLAEQEISNGGSPEKCFASQGDEFWRCIASFIKEETEKPLTEA